MGSLQTQLSYSEENIKNTKQEVRDLQVERARLLAEVGLKYSLVSR